MSVFDRAACKPRVTRERRVGEFHIVIIKYMKKLESANCINIKRKKYTKPGYI